MFVAAPFTHNTVIRHSFYIVFSTIRFIFQFISLVFYGQPLFLCKSEFCYFVRSICFGFCALTNKCVSANDCSNQQYFIIIFIRLQLFLHFIFQIATFSEFKSMHMLSIGNCSKIPKSGKNSLIFSSNFLPVNNVAVNFNFKKLFFCRLLGFWATFMNKI